MRKVFPVVIPYFAQGLSGSDSYTSCTRHMCKTIMNTIRAPPPVENKKIKGQLLVSVSTPFDAILGAAFKTKIV